MIIEAKNSDVFIPTFNDNKEQPVDEQIKVHHRYFLPSERKKYIYTEPIVVDVGTGEVDGKVKYVQDEQGIAKALITKIENLTISIDGKEKKVQTVKEMYETPGVPQALVTEIELYLLSASPEVKADFLEQPSPSN